MTHCMRHFEEPMAGVCRTCNRPFCGRCLVFAFGPDKPPYCVGCALAASGVRNNMKTVVVAGGATPTADRRLERAQKRAEKAQHKAEAKALKRAAKDGQPDVPMEPVRTSNVPVPKGLNTPSSRYAPTTNPEHAVN